MSKSSKPESFPLIITDDNNDSNNSKLLNNLNEWSDQELDDLFQSPIEEVLDSMRYRSSPKVSRRQCLKSVLFLSLISFVFGLSFAVLIISGYQSVNANVYYRPQLRPTVLTRPESLSKTSKTINKTIDRLLQEAISADRIARNLKALTRKPIIGETGLDDNTLFVFNKWTKLGLNTSLVNYTVLMSYQDINKPNSVVKFDKNDQMLYNSSQYEDPLNAPPEEAKYYRLNPPYLAYSPSTAEPLKGTPVYVNYGRAEDYDTLATIGVNVSDHIVIARYGKIFRANIVKLAQDNGAIGVIIYSDPYDYTDFKPDATYPNSVYLPKSGVQRGTIQMGDGDPETPFYPSIDSAYRIGEDKTNLPRIPAQSISYNDAIHIMNGLSGPIAPANWTGKLNITYKVGPGYEDDSYLTVEVNTYRKQSVIHNVIATIDGCAEPDRYVIVGNHRDAWTFGAADPLSGTAAMLEMSEALMETMKRQNWCPRRSIVFCSWAAEEYGLIGSTEWVEEHQNLLQNQAIAYLNVDIAVQGNFTFQANAVPLLYSTIVSATKLVDNPNKDEVNAGLATVFDSYKLHRPSKLVKDLPEIATPGSGSDHSPFIEIAGVPVVDFYYDCEDTHIHCYPLYHTMYETFEMMANLTDRGFQYSRALTRVWAEMMRSLADSPLLPFADSLTNYPKFLWSAVKNLQNSDYKNIFSEHNITFDHLNEAIRQFDNEVRRFVERIKRIDESNDLQIRSVNDIMMSLERSFLDVKGLPFREDWHHVVVAPSALDSYNGSSFAGLYFLLWKYSHENNESNQLSLLENIRQHISVITFHVNSAKLVVKQRFD